MQLRTEIIEVYYKWWSPSDLRELFKLWLLKKLIGQTSGYIKYVNDVNITLFKNDIPINDSIAGKIWHDWVDGYDSVTCSQEIILNQIQSN